jgi:hypothetical protein
MTQPNQPVRVRLSVLDLTAAQMGQYVQAVKQLKKTDAPGGDPAIPAAPGENRRRRPDVAVDGNRENRDTQRPGFRS